MASPTVDNKSVPQPAAEPEYFGPTHGTVYDARDGVTPLAAGQVAPVYACTGPCDPKQPYAGADMSQAVPLSNGEFHFNQAAAPLAGYYIVVPGYKPQFVPRGFRNPMQRAMYSLHTADGEGDPDDETDTSMTDTQPETPGEGDDENGDMQEDESGQMSDSDETDTTPADDEMTQTTARRPKTTMMMVMIMARTTATHPTTTRVMMMMMMMVMARTTATRPTTTRVIMMTMGPTTAFPRRTA
jgi:hypothetical protein